MAESIPSSARWDDIDLHKTSEDGDEEEVYRYHGSYRETSPQYLGGRGLVRYSSALRHLIPIRTRQKTKREVLGIDRAGLISLVTFGWLTKYILRTYRKGITIEEIPSIPPSDSCDYNAQRLEVMWQQELGAKGPRAASLKLVVWKFIRTRVLVATFILTLNIMCGFVSVAFLMRWLIEFAEDSSAPMSQGLWLAVGLAVSELLRVLFYATVWAVSYRTGIRLRAACLTMLYRKIIRTHSLGDKTIGELVNLFASDGQRLYTMVVFGPMIIMGPVVLTLAVCYIFWLLSPWALLGLLVFILFYPIQYGMSRLVGRYQARVIQMADKRISLTTEILTFIKLIKMYAWEKPFTSNLFDLREKELALLQKAMYLQSLTVSIASTIPIITAIFMFLCHISMGYSLSSSQAFSAVSFCLRQLSTTMIFTSESWKSVINGLISVSRLQAFSAVGLCMKQLRNVMRTTKEGLTKIVEGTISVDRLQAFPALVLLNTLVLSCRASRESCDSILRASSLLQRIKSVMVLEEISPYLAKPMDKSQAVCISNGNFSWDSPPPEKTKKKSKKQSKTSKKKNEVPAEIEETINLTSTPKPEPVLREINFYVPKGSLVGVCGQVGAGKSSLLAAALGQLRMDSGKMSRVGSCAYVSQQPWILNATVKENIIFGETFNAKRYFYTRECCSLNEDIKLLPGEDETEVGERGINLSGGQKQRLALARALYANRDIYLLDDPLSSVDSHVGAHIFNKYIIEALQHKSVVFVTHQIQWLTRCDEVCVMKDGNIVERGTHKQLVAQGGEYAAMVETWQQTQNNTPSPDNKSDSGVFGLDEKCLSGEKISNISSPEKENSETNGTIKPQGDERDGRTLTKAEHIEQGSLHLETYMAYVKAAGGFCVVLSVVLIMFINVGTAAFSSWWLAFWIQAGNGEVVRNESVFIGNETVYENVTVFGSSLADNPDFDVYRSIYAVTVIAILATNLIRGFVFANVSLNASRRLHSKLFNKVIRTTMEFFETTPLGRLHNLFSKDMDEVDSYLPFTIEVLLEDTCTIIFAFFFISMVFPAFTVPFLVLFVIYILISRIFRVAVRDLKRLENASRSPILSAVSSTVAGLSTIHAFNKENQFISKFTNLFDLNSTCMLMSAAAVRWLALRIDGISVLIVFTTALMSVFLHNQVPAPMIGLAIAYSSTFSGVFQYVIRMVTEAETRLVSVERITSYLQILSVEGGSGPKGKPWPGWPQRGNIHFNRVSLQYRSNLPTVLHQVSFKVKDGEKLGIVGRTGSGKSSLTSALFQLVELSEGSVEVDQLNISSLDLEQLRNQLTIIPQDPVLFSGTLRMNLDPLVQYEDERLWAALEKTQMKEKVQGMKDKLHTQIGSGGVSLSVGEKQLLCLARALLRNTKIIVLDEATASIDPDTEAALHAVINSEFRDCTVLTIAHRLASVTDCDRVLVMDSGRVVELDSPAKLLEQPDSKFSQMLNASKQTNS